MPFLQARRALANVRLSLPAESPRSVRLGRVRRKTFLAFLLLGPISRPGLGRHAGVTGRWPRPRLICSPCYRADAASSGRPGPGDAARGAQAPAAPRSAGKGLVVLARSDKIHFIGFVLKFDIGSWDSSFMSPMITIPAGTFKRCVNPFY